VTVTSALLAEELDDVHVFHARRLRDGVQLQDTARFRTEAGLLRPSRCNAKNAASSCTSRQCPLSTDTP
jgi:hypothetical protein